MLMPTARSVASRSHLSKAPKISIREWIIAGVAAATLAFSAWGLGGIPSWCLHILFAGGVSTFLLSISEFRLSKRFYFPLSIRSIFRLFTWGPFYFSLAFLIYLLIGALNPAVQVLEDEHGWWWVEAIQARWPLWLPISVRSNYEPMNAWRVLEVFTGATALMWGIQAGLTRRKPVLLVLWSLVLSGVGMAMVGIIQHLTEAKLVLWTFRSSNENFWGSYFYRNQGVAYLNLILVASGVLYFYHAWKSRERVRSGGPHFLCVVFFMIVLLSVGLALSRGGIIFAGILSFVFLILAVVQVLFGLWHTKSFGPVLIGSLFLLSGAFILTRYADFDAIEQRFDGFRKNVESMQNDYRYLAGKATWEMAQRRLWQGWGPGSFRYIFPMYQRKYPELYYHYYKSRTKEWVGRRIYRYAHNDILQFLAEYGIIGSALIWITLIWIVLSLFFRSFSFSALFLLFGFIASLGYAFVDFIFSSPAYWFAFVGILTASARLFYLEAKGHSQTQLGKT